MALSVFLIFPTAPDMSSGDSLLLRPERIFLQALNPRRLLGETEHLEHAREPRAAGGCERYFSKSDLCGFCWINPAGLSLLPPRESCSRLGETSNTPIATPSSSNPPGLLNHGSRFPSFAIAKTFPPRERGRGNEFFLPANSNLFPARIFSLVINQSRLICRSPLPRRAAHIHLQIPAGSLRPAEPPARGHHRPAERGGRAATRHRQRLHAGPRAAGVRPRGRQRRHRARHADRHRAAAAGGAHAAPRYDIDKVFPTRPSSNHPSQRRRNGNSLERGDLFL